jgi:hypothetical protein
MRKAIPLLIVILFLAATAHAQSFSSGSTGTDGALDLSSCPTTTCRVQLPESGVLNYTTVNVPPGKELVFKRNSRNTPVTMLAQGDISIQGHIFLAGGVTEPVITLFPYSNPGPGGFAGGSSNRPGFGPGGGQLGSLDEARGRWVGPLSLFPIVGGSGAAGYGGLNGGGGGGAIVIASSGSIVMTSAGFIDASGSADGPGAGGAGGAIRLVANSINVSGGLQATGGYPEAGKGVIRLEGPANALIFSGTSNPPAGLFPINPSVVPSALPSLIIVSIAGFPVPTYAGQRFDTYDMLLPNQLTDPISVVVHANNIPVDTQVTVGFVNGSPTGTSTPGSLAGTFESSSATATISNLNRTAVTYLLATATFDPPMGAMKFNPKGPNHVAKIRVVASPGGKPRFVFLRNNGTTVDQAKLSKQFLEQLGL